MMASARYSHLAADNPAKDILPSFVMYTCHLLAMFSLCVTTKSEKKNEHQICKVQGNKYMQSIVKS